MSRDQLPADFAPHQYHVVRVDLPRVQGAGRFYDVGIAAATLDFLRKQVPEADWRILCDDGVLDDRKITRKPCRSADFDYLAKALGYLAKPSFHIVKKAA